MGIAGNSYPSTTRSFNLLTTTKPSGLIDGSTNFYTTNQTLCSLIGSVAGLSTTSALAWQGATFSSLPAGSYQFTYIPISTPTPDWEPYNTCVLTTTLTLTSTAVVIPPPAVVTGNACRPPKSGKFPCGPAFASFLSTAGYVQYPTNETCLAFDNTPVTPFCGSQPVNTQFSFSNNGSAIGNANFLTADGSCRCDWCYEINNFDQSVYCFTNGSGWVWSNPAAVGFYNSVAGSYGINFNAFTGDNSTLTTTESIRKRTVSFWIRTEFRTGDYLQFSIDGVIPPAAYVSGCPYTDVAGQRWTGSLTCTVVIDVSFLPTVPCVSTFSWFASRNNAVSKRVNPVIPPVPVPELRGVWLDTVQGCGLNYP